MPQHKLSSLSALPDLNVHSGLTLYLLGCEGFCLSGRGRECVCCICSSVTGACVFVSIAVVQAADVSKLHNEVTMLRKKLAGTENTLAKQGNDLKGQVANLKTKLAQTERDLNDSQIQCASTSRISS